MIRKKALLILLLGAISCGKDSAPASGLAAQKEQIVKQIDSLNNLLKQIELQEAASDNSRKLVVTTLLPKDDVFKHFIELQGVVKADQNINLRPEMSGQITAILVKEGQRVRKGQTLMQLDDALVQDNIAKVETQLSLAKTTFERQKRLWEQKIGSEMQYLQAKTNYESLLKNINALRTQASKLKIVAPFSGIVDEIFPKKGELASPQVPVIRLVNLDKVFVEAEVTETYLPFIRKGSETKVYFPSINKEVSTKISQVGNVINPDNRSFRVKIQIPNRDNLIKPNLLADIHILDFYKKGIIIPSKLIQKDNSGKDYVFVLDESSAPLKVRKRIVKVENEYKNQSLIAEGLKAGDKIIDKGASIVKDGDIVEERQ